LRNFGLTIDADGYSHFWSNPFGTETGRNASPAAELIFLMPGWLRFLIKPKEGWAISYHDYSSQEVIIAAADSHDLKMISDYYKDIYLQRATRAGKAPVGATKATHKDIRDRFKPLVLGINYGQTCYGLAKRLGITQAEAQELLSQYLADYPDFARRRQAIVNGVRRPNRTFFTPLGWPFWVGGQGKSAHTARKMSNHPIQSTGADMMRVAMIALTEAGIRVCCSLHDGFLITAPIDQIEEHARLTNIIMKGAGAALLGVQVMVGSPVITRYPDRFVPEDKEGKNVHSTWELVQHELARLRRKAA
jgi:DNA polymerase I